MTRRQRLFAIVGAAALAVLLHAGLCDWRFRAEYRPDGMGHRGADGRPIPTSPEPIFMYTHRPYARSGGAGGEVVSWIASGVFTQGDSRSLSFVFGLATPLFLLGFAGFLAIGWRGDARLARGQCPRCGYGLQGADSPLPRCTECGWTSVLGKSAV